MIFECEDCNKEKQINEKVDLIDPFSGKIYECICESCNENRVQRQLEEFYG